MDTRVHVTLTPEVFAIVTELAELRLTSRPALLREFLSGAAPSLQASIDMIRMMQNATPEKMAAIAKLLESAEQQADLKMDSVQGILSDNSEPK